ncbi:hypothetical protein GUJ93_ZPchr0009g185 [Zizania palustris]|uniref:phosphoribosylaminoimidazolesuccinocarboxamide synthase n=1 Tax=Zizania palustris TaxID=103762 RepID=A0A8J5RIR0_ZIZPA|nr:hypothetical protein GUJ93_ZPchr0009g185 [Zizania palustris]
MSPRAPPSAVRLWRLPKAVLPTSSSIVLGSRLAFFGEGEGRVRERGEHTTDQQSAFDRGLASIPFKGQELKMLLSGSVVSSPDKNVTIAKRCSVFPVEFVVRGYVTGSTDTSLYGKESEAIFKAVDHDVPVTPEEIINSGLTSKEDVDKARSKALSLFAFGQDVALENGLILVDTTYEFGKTADGTIMLIDEVTSSYMILSL